MTLLNLKSLPIANIIPSWHEFESRLNQTEPLNLYHGIDPTATQIHLGHAVSLRILQTFADAGHQVTFLIGDFTALIGDTSDKESERPILNQDEIIQNFQTYQQQATKFLNFDQVKVVHNSKWLSQLGFADIVKLAQNFSTNDFISRELIRKRLDQGKRVGLHETLYPLMQGYDMYKLDADLQIGGTDQTFNMQAGRTLQKKLNNKESYIITTPFLTGTDGKKMSKTSGNAIWLNDPPEEVYGKVMSITDELILEYFQLATSLTPEQIQLITGLTKCPTMVESQNQEFKLDTQNSKLETDPLNVKKRLAHQITLELYDPAAADQAQDHFESTVQGSDIPEDIPTFTPSQSPSPIDILIQNQLAQSRGEARRLVEQGGFRLNNQKVTDPNAPVQLNPGDIIQAGKRSYLRVQ